MTTYRDTQNAIDHHITAVFGAPAARLRRWLEFGGTGDDRGAIEVTADALVENFAHVTGLTKGAVTDVVGISQPTRSRARKTGAPASVDAADRMFQATQLFARAAAMLGEDKARQWLVKPNRHLGGRAPADLLPTSTGRERFSQYLDSLEDSTYA